MSSLKFLIKIFLKKCVTMEQPCIYWFYTETYASANKIMLSNGKLKAM